MAANTEYRVRVLFQTVLGNLEQDVRRAGREIRSLGVTGRQAGEEGSEGLDELSRSAGEASDRLGRTESRAMQIGSNLKKIFTEDAVAFAGQKLFDFGQRAVEEFGVTQKALGEMSSLGYEDLETLRQAAVDFSNTWSGTTRESFINAAYDIKSGIAALSDAGVAEFTEMAGLTAKATKSTVDQMTSLFAKAYAVYRNQFGSDKAFGEAFSASIAKATQLFRTQGSEMESYLSSLGAAAANAGVSLEEVVNIGGVLQTQAGTTGSEASTQYASLLKNALKASEALGLSFLDNNGKLLPALDIVERIRGKFGDTLEASEKFQLTQAFGDEMSVSFVDNLYNKIEEARQSQRDVNQAMQGGLETTRAMGQTMNNGVPDKLEQIQNAWSNLLDQVGGQIEPGLSPALDEVHAKLVELQSSGDFSSIGQSLGMLVQSGSQLLTQVLNHAPGAIAAAANMLKFLADNLDLVIFAMRACLTVWIGFKAASAISGTISAVSNLFGGLTQSVGKVKTALTLLKTLFMSNPLGLLITAVIILVSWFVKATDGVTGWKNKFTVALSDIKSKFFGIVGAISRRWADFIGMFNESWGESAHEFADSMDDRVRQAQETIHKIKGDKAGRSDASKTDGKKPQESSLNPGGLPAPGGGGSGGSSGSGAAGAASTIDDKINEINEKYAADLENRELKADWAEKQNRSADAAAMRQQSIDLLKQQAGDLLLLEGGQSGKNKTLVENARLKILGNIQEIAEDIRGGVGKIAGEFSKPSELTAMTKYQYMVERGGGERGRSTTNGNLSMQFTIKNPDSLSAEQLKRYIREWAMTGAESFGADYDTARDMLLQMTRT